MSQCVYACLCKYMHILTDLRRSLLSTLVTLCVQWGHGCSYDMGPLLKHLKSESPVAHYEMWRLRKDRNVVANIMMIQIHDATFDDTFDYKHQHKQKGGSTTTASKTNMFRASYHYLTY